MRTVILILSLIAMSAVAKEHRYHPRVGDVILCDYAPPGPLGPFIKALSGSSVTHCGIVAPEGVIEAIGPVVCVTPIQEFRERVDGKYKVLRPRHQCPWTMWRFIQNARAYIGTPYDMAWNIDPQQVYCSELIAVCWPRGGFEPVTVGSLNYQGWEWLIAAIGLDLESLVFPPGYLERNKQFRTIYDSM